jgi:hypothetical protein
MKMFELQIEVAVDDEAFVIGQARKFNEKYNRTTDAAGKVLTPEEAVPELIDALQLMYSNVPLGVRLRELGISRKTESGVAA